MSGPSIRTSGRRRSARNASPPSMQPAPFRRAHEQDRTMTTTDFAIGPEQFSVVVEAFGGGNRNLLFLHGMEGPPSETEFLEELGKTRNVIAPVHPGFGDSTGIQSLGDMLDVALFYRRLLRELGVTGPMDV